MVREWTKEFRWVVDGATEASIRDAEDLLGVSLPAEYLEVLRLHNGGEGFVGEGSYLQLWSIEDLADRNQTLDAASLVPGTVLFASDGADDLYAIETAGNGPVEFAIYPAVGLSTEYRETIADTWSGFLEKLGERR